VPRADPNEPRDRADIVTTSIHVDYTLFGETEKKEALVTFGNDEKGQKRKAEHRLKPSCSARRTCGRS
jgi:hypothetical protein